MKKLCGAVTALVTPFQKNGSVDETALRAFVRFQLKSGIDAVVPCGSTGEAATLNEVEYRMVIRTVVEEVNGTVPVIAGAGSNDTQRAVQNSIIAKEAGADALLHVTPYYNKPTANGLVSHFGEIARHVNLPIILYNVPGRTGQNISAAVTLRVAREVDHVVGVKEASGDIMQMMAIIKKAPAYFSVLAGDDAITLPLLAAGGDGCISVVSNEVPRQFTKLVQLALNGDFVRARKIHYQLLDLMNANFIETNPLPVKTALSMMGHIKEVFRLPLVPMVDANKQTLRTVLKDLKLV